LHDHKVGHDQSVRVDGIEYKPPWARPGAFPWPTYLVLVTCTRWKLLKKTRTRLAEFQIEWSAPSAGQRFIVSSR